MEYILGPLIAIFGFIGILKFVKWIDSSKNESVQQIVRAAGTASAIAIAKRAAKNKD